VRVLKNLMLCNYTSLNYYLEVSLKVGKNFQVEYEIAASLESLLLLSCFFRQYGRSHHWLFNHNAPLWKYCTEQGDFRSSYCWTPPFLNRYSFQPINVVIVDLRVLKVLKPENFDLAFFTIDPDQTPDPTPFFSDFKDANFFYNLPAGT